MTDNDPRSHEGARADRRQELVLAAYARIASEGFEGLRTRDVAADVGINVATLHYYFPTKEALIRGVVGHAMQRFATTMPKGGPAAEQLRGHLSALRRLLKEEPELGAVLCELALRTPRDSAIASIVWGADEPWYRLLRGLLARAVEQGGLDAGLDPDAAAGLMISVIKGLNLPMEPSIRAQRVDQTFGQLERWLGLPASPSDELA